MLDAAAAAIMEADGVSSCLNWCSWIGIGGGNCGNSEPSVVSSSSPCPDSSFELSICLLEEKERENYYIDQWRLFKFLTSQFTPSRFNRFVYNPQRVLPITQHEEAVWKSVNIEIFSFPYINAGDNEVQQSYRLITTSPLVMTAEKRKKKNENWIKYAKTGCQYFQKEVIGSRPLQNEKAQRFT